MHWISYIINKRMLTNLNKKLVYIFAVLIIGIFLISACQQDAVGARIAKRAKIGAEGNSIFATMSCSDNGGGGWDRQDGTHWDYKCSVTCEDGTTFTAWGNSNFGEPEYGMSDAVNGCKRRGSN